MPYLKKPTPDPEPLDCRILSAALDLFVERGFHNVSIHDVQKTAAVSIGSIYNHFGGKKGVAKALYTHLLSELQLMIDEVVLADMSHRERCNRVIALLFEYTESHPNIIAYLFNTKHREFLHDEPPICNSTPLSAMRGIVQSGIDAGEINPGILWVVASSVFGGAIRMIQLRLDGVINEPLGEYYDQLIDGIWGGLATP